MPVYRYIAVDLLTHSRLAELPLAGVRWGDRLNHPGALRATLKLPAHDPTLAAVQVDATDPGRRALYVERDGVLVWGGPIWTRNYDPTDQTLELGASTWSSILFRRVITDTQTFAGVDQADIVRSLVAYTQAKPGGALGITYGAEVTGINRDQTWLYTDNKIVGEAISDLSDNINGFDWSIDVAYSGNNITRTLRIWYPRRGRIAGTTGHVFELGRNITEFTWPDDSTTTANSILAVGAGAGDSTIRSSASDPSQWTAGYPLLEDTVARKDISVQTTLDSLVTSMLAARAQPIALPVVTVRGDLDPVLGAYIAGDEARFRSDPNTDPRFPNGLDTYRRIVAYVVEVPDSGGGENVNLVLDEAA